MRVFVYGTLKRGGRLHEHMAKQTFIGTARTASDYRLFHIEWYPGLIEVPAGTGVSVEGEVWDLDAAGLRLLDEVEETENGLYERRTIRLEPPFDQPPSIDAWFYLGDVRDRVDCGTSW